MGCIVEFSDSGFRFNFVKNKYRQKSLIEVMLLFGKLGVSQLSELIGVTEQTLVEVRNGHAFLSKKPAKVLGKLFLLLFSE